jgi:hypothetical protein
MSEFFYDRSKSYANIMDGSVDYTFAKGGVTCLLVESSRGNYKSMLAHGLDKDSHMHKYCDCEINENKWLIHLYDLLGRLN